MKITLLAEVASSNNELPWHYDDVIMTMLASQITSLTVVYSIVYSGVNQRKHQSSASLAFVWEIHRGPVNFPHKWPVTRKMFPFDDVIMVSVNVLSIMLLILIWLWMTCWWIDIITVMTVCAFYFFTVAKYSQLCQQNFPNSHKVIHTSFV